MLKRNDLAKQFELIVQQEIKNHNDQMLATNLAINAIREKVDANRLNQDKINNFVDSWLANSSQASAQICDSILGLSKKFDSYINDVQRLDIRKSTEIEELFDMLHKAFREIAELRNILESHERDILGFNESIKKLSQAFLEEMSSGNKKIGDELKRMLNDFLSRPSEASAVRNELLAHMNVDRVDFEGLMKEIQIYKKEKFIQEKKIEQLYTLVDRLQRKAG